MITVNSVSGGKTSSYLAKHYPADYNIVIARNACGTLEFDRAREMIDLGYKSAEKILNNNQQLVSK